MSVSPTTPPEDDEAWTLLLRTMQPPQPAEPRPFLHARLLARLEAEQAPSAAWPWWARRPAYAAAAGVLLLALNAGAAVHYSRQLHPAPAPAGYAAFAAAYHLDPLRTPHD